MIKHIVQPSDTVESIAEKYGISAERLILENEIINPNRMATGETLLIVYPKQTYIVQEGETLTSIADAHGVSWIDLLRNNPYISDRGELVVGEEIVIQFEDDKIASITINGYAYPYINRNVLLKTLPFLTYLTILGYHIFSNGTIDDINDIELIQIAREFSVGSIMQIFTYGEGIADNTVFYTILHDDELQDKLIINILTTLRLKGYYGVNIDVPYILPGDKELFVEFIEKVTRQLNAEGFLLIATLSPSTFEVATAITYYGIDYTGIGLTANNVIYNLSYDWRNPYGIPKSALSFEAITKAMSNATEHIVPDKLLLGVTSVGYLWQLPYVPGKTITTFINHTNAVDIARENGLEIQFNDINQSSYIHYIEGGLEYMVLLKDVRSMAAYPALIMENNLSGISFFNIMYYFPRTWLLFNSQFDIKKVLA